MSICKACLHKTSNVLTLRMSSKQITYIVWGQQLDPDTQIKSSKSLHSKDRHSARQQVIAYDTARMPFCAPTNVSK